MESELLLRPYAEERFPLTETWEESAAYLGMTVQQLLHLALVQPTSLRVIDIPGKGAEPDKRASVLALPGHLWGGSLGPQRADVMIVGKMPGDIELRLRRNFAGPPGELLQKLFKEFGADCENFYVTSVLKFMPPDGTSKVRAYHVKDCATLLMHEIMAVDPQFMLLIGADAIKFVFGRKATLASTRGAVLPFAPGDIGTPPKVGAENRDEAIVYAEFAKSVMTAVHPAQVLREPSMVPGLRADIKAFVELTTGKRKKHFVSPAETNDYRYVSTADELKPIVDDLIARNITDFAVDCEWGGEDYLSGWLRTIQFSWAAGKAVVVILCNCESQRKPVFEPTGFHALDLLHKLFDRPGVHIFGQFFRSDALWLEDLGLRVMERLSFDTVLADHALNESQEHNLTAMTLRYTDMGRYDIELTQWVKQHGTPDGGYGAVPDHLLHPYAAADADAEYRISLHLMAELDKPENASVRNLYYNTILPATQPIHEMERNGIQVDPERMVDLLWRYHARKRQLLAELRNLISWPDFNPRSFKQKAELLFGEPKDGGLGLTPVKSTEKPSREWADVMKLPADERARVNPSTDAESLELLQLDTATAHQKKVVETVQNFQIIDQVTKNFLRPPDHVAVMDEYGPEDFDLFEYTGGLIGQMDEDGRIRTTISQIKETGRHGSSNPNLQNISKRQEPRYQQIMGYKIEKIRSCFQARPGYVLIEADYRSAEIVTLAYISGDPNLIADALGPVKLHSKVAVDILGANCAYEDVAEKFPHLYVGAKNINFGIPYQRGARAIARQVNRETKGAANMTADQAQTIIDAWYVRYSMVESYVDYCKDSVRNPPHYIETPWGRRRHFYVSESESVMAAQERECVNFPIQSTVADALNTALYNLWAFRRMHPEINYDILLAIHDAVILEVPIAQIETVVDYVLPLCMVHGAEIPASHRSPAFRLDIDSEVALRWGETPDRDELARLGVPEKYWPKAA